MARLYEYVKSSDQSGQFIIGGDGGSTLHPSPTGRALFDHLGYDPPTKPEGKGTHIPSDLFWAMYNTGWIKSGDEDPGKVDQSQPTSVDGQHLDTQLISSLKLFIQKRHDTRRFAEELGLNDENKNKRITDLTDSEQETLENHVSAFVENRLRDEEKEGEDPYVSYFSENIGDGFTDSEYCEISLVTFYPDRSSDGRTLYATIMYIHHSHGLEKIKSRAGVSKNLQSKTRMSEQRAYLLGAISALSGGGHADIEFAQLQVSDDVTDEFIFNRSDR